MGNYEFNPFTGKLDISRKGFLKRSGDTANNDSIYIFPDILGHKWIKVDGSLQEISFLNDFDTTKLTITNQFTLGISIENTNTNNYTYINDNGFSVSNLSEQTYMRANFFKLEHAEGDFTIDWFPLKKQMRFSGTNMTGVNLYGSGSNGSQTMLTFGDWFSNTTPYVAIREDSGSDTDVLQLYGQKGVQQHVSALLGTAVTTCTQTGRFGINNELPSYTVDVSGGDINTSGNYRKGGTIGYLTSALGTQSAGAPVLANLRTRNLTINGVTIKVVEEL